MHRNQSRASWVRKALVFSVSTTVAGVASGALLGGVGNLVSLDTRIVLTTGVAMLAMIAGGLEFAGRRLVPLQCDRETPQLWMQSGAIAWATRNGLALGCGATTRVGFWLWYLVPGASFLIGEPYLGAVLYGTYGLVRGLGAWGLIATGAILRRTRGMSFDDFTLWLIKRQREAQMVAAAQLLVLGITVIIAIGL